MEDLETWQVEDQGSPRNINARPQSWSGMFMMTTPKKLGQVGRMYHSRGQRGLQCSTWASLTLIGCGQDLVTSDIASPCASYIQLEDVETKWRFLTILRNISNLERWPKSAIPKSVACMMYAEHVLRVRVDWSIWVL